MNLRIRRLDGCGGGEMGRLKGKQEISESEKQRRAKGMTDASSSLSSGIK